MTTNATIRYCANGCTRRQGDERNPVQLDPTNRSLICRHCEDNIQTWLDEIPTHYTLLPRFIEHGSTEQNPDSKATKSPQAPPPMRLDVIDLLDERLGRKWQGIATTTDRRGVLGVLQPHTDRIRDERRLTTPPPATVADCARFLERHLLWLTEQDWINDFTDELKQLHTSLSHAVGIYKRPPVGRCHIVTDTQGGTCDGPLFPTKATNGVHCARCYATWDADHLRQLGLAQAEQETA